MVPIETFEAFSANEGVIVISADKESVISPANALASGVPSAASAVSSC